jgi:hypothetical protein
MLTLIIPTQVLYISMSLVLRVASEFLPFCSELLTKMFQNLRSAASARHQVLIVPRTRKIGFAMYIDTENDFPNINARTIPPRPRLPSLTHVMLNDRRTSHFEAPQSTLYQTSFYNLILLSSGEWIVLGPSEILFSG